MLDCYGSLPKIAAKIKTRSWFQNEMGGSLHFAPSGLSSQFPYIGRGWKAGKYESG